MDWLWKGTESRVADTVCVRYPFEKQVKNLRLKVFRQRYFPLNGMSVRGLGADPNATRGGRQSFPGSRTYRTVPGGK